MRTLVTGATGFIGAHVARHLRNAGHEVRGLVRPGGTPADALPDGVVPVLGDVRDADAVARAARGVDAIFHVAALYSLSRRRAAAVRSVNVDGTRVVIDVARASGARLVHTSSVATIGIPGDGTHGDEETPQPLSQVIGAYKASKVEAEGLVRKRKFRSQTSFLGRSEKRLNTIGAAKKDLDKRVVAIRERLAAKGGDARVSVLKAVVTQASAAIPAMPIYLAILFKVMKAKGTHEGCIEQIDRLFREALYGDKALDDEGRCRVDDLELLPEVQAEVAGLWDQIDTDNLNDLSDFSGYRQEFLQLFGFEVDGVDYDADVDPAVTIAQLVS